MMNFKEYLEQNNGRQVLISTLSGKLEGILWGSKAGQDGEISSLIIKQYLHRTEVDTKEILNIRLR